MHFSTALLLLASSSLYITSSLANPLPQMNINSPSPVILAARQNAAGAAGTAVPISPSHTISIPSYSPTPTKWVRPTSSDYNPDSAPLGMGPIVLSTDTGSSNGTSQGNVDPNAAAGPGAGMAGAGSGSDGSAAGAGSDGSAAAAGSDGSAAAAGSDGSAAGAGSDGSAAGALS